MMRTNRSMWVFTRIAFVAFLLLGWTGCHRAQPIETWRAQLQEQLDTQTKGEPAIVALADQRSPRQPRPGRIMFCAMDVSSRRGDCDVRGELVDVVEYDGRAWDVFLVGTLSVDGGSTRDLIDLRPVATCVDGDDRRWLVGEPDKAQLAAYRDARGIDAIRHGGFPLATDRFQSKASDKGIVVTDHDSDAHWTLSASAPTH